MKRDIHNDIKRVSVYVDQIQLFVIMNNVEMKINVGVNVRNQLIKAYVIKDLFGEYLDCSNCKCRKKLFDKLVEECTKNIDVIKIDNENENENKYSFFIVYIVHIVLFSIILG